MSEDSKKPWQIFRRKSRAAPEKAPAPIQEKAAAIPPMDRLMPERRTFGDHTVGGNELICSAVGLISRMVAACDIHLKQNHEIMTRDWREQLINCQPNDVMTPYTFRAIMETQRATTGQAYALLVPDRTDTMIDRIDVIDPRLVQRVRDTETGLHWYRMQLSDTQVLIPRERMLSLKFMPTMDGSVSPIRALTGALDFGEQIQDITIRQMKGVRDTIMLNVPGGVGLGVAGQKNVVEQFLEVYNATDGGVAVLQGQMSASVLRRDMIDSKLIDLDKVTGGKIRSVYSIPPALMGDYSGSGESAEQQMQQFLQTCIAPELQQWVDELNQATVTREERMNGISWEYDVDRILDMMPNTAASYYKNAVRGGWMKPNDIRRKKGLPDDPDGNRLMVSRDLIPLDIVVNHPEMLLGTENMEEEKENE